MADTELIRDFPPREQNLALALLGTMRVQPAGVHPGDRTWASLRRANSVSSASRFQTNS